MLDQNEFTRIRALTNAVIAEENSSGRTRNTASVRRIEAGARITVGVQEGSRKPSDPLIHLGSLCERIMTELRLERDSLGRPAFRSQEPTFTSGDSPTFTFEVHPAQ